MVRALSFSAQKEAQGNLASLLAGTWILADVAEAA